MATNYVPEPRGTEATYRKVCSRCSIEKPVECFYRAGRYADGYFTYCKVCHRQKGKEWRATNKDKHRKLIQDNHARYLDRNLRIVLDHVREHPCVDCGEKDPMVLQFDHVRGEKKFEIGVALGSRNPEALQEEIAKCDVRCANCHQKKTLIARNSEKYQLLVKEYGYGK